MYPVCKQQNHAAALLSSVYLVQKQHRIEKPIPSIHVREVPNGFQVLFTNQIPIESIPSVQRQSIRDKRISHHTRDPTIVFSLTIWRIETMEGKVIDFMLPFSYGVYSDITAIQQDALIANSRQGNKWGNVLNRNELSLYVFFT
jgi:hypothetical protein